MTIVTTNSRGRGAAARSAADQALPPALQRAAARRQIVPVHPPALGDHAFPRIQKHRGARRAKGNYYGPFASAGSVNTTINALQKLFLLRSCNDGYMSRRDRPCLLYQIKRCSAPCVGPHQRGRLCRTGRGRRRTFLGGKSGAVQKEIEARDGRGSRGAGLSNAPPCCATGCAPLTVHSGQPGGQRRSGVRRC